MKQSKYKKRGWYGESRRHYLAAKGISTSKRKTTSKYARRYNYTPTYAAGDLPLIAADGVGTAGAAAVPLLPLVVFSGLAYAGAKHVKKKKDKTGSYFKFKDTTGIMFDDDILKRGHKQKRKVEFATMDPEDVLKLQFMQARASGSDSSFDRFIGVSKKYRNPEGFARLKEGISDENPLVPLVAIELSTDGQLSGFQEGRNRALAARELGLKEMPVVIAKRRISEGASFPASSEYEEILQRETTERPLIESVQTQLKSFKRNKSKPVERNKSKPVEELAPVKTEMNEEMKNLVRERRLAKLRQKILAGDL